MGNPFQTICGVTQDVLTFVKARIIDIIHSFRPSYMSKLQTMSPFLRQSYSPRDHFTLRGVQLTGPVIKARTSQDRLTLKLLTSAYTFKQVSREVVTLKIISNTESCFLRCHQNWILITIVLEFPSRPIETFSPDRGEKGAGPLTDRHQLHSLCYNLSPGTNTEQTTHPHLLTI